MSEPRLRFTRVSLFSGLLTSRTEYICSPNTRSESRNCSGHSATTPPSDVQYEYGPRVHIHNRDLSYGFQLDLWFVCLSGQEIPIKVMYGRNWHLRPVRL